MSSIIFRPNGEFVKIEMIIELPGLKYQTMLELPLEVFQKLQEVLGSGNLFWEDDKWMYNGLNELVLGKVSISGEDLISDLVESAVSRKATTWKFPSTPGNWSGVHLWNLFGMDFNMDRLQLWVNLETIDGGEFGFLVFVKSGPLELNHLSAGLTPDDWADIRKLSILSYQYLSEWDGGEDQLVHFTMSPDHLTLTRDDQRLKISGDLLKLLRKTSTGGGDSEYLKFYY